MVFQLYFARQFHDLELDEMPSAVDTNRRRFLAIGRARTCLNLGSGGCIERTTDDEIIRRGGEQVGWWAPGDSNPGPAD